MPGKKGVKLMPRKSTSGKYFSVKALVFSLLEKNKDISRAEVEKIVRKEYPNSSFLPKNGKGGHFPWYKHQFLRMALEKDNFQLKERSVERKEEKEEVVNAGISNESEASSVIHPDELEPAGVVEMADGEKDRRIQVYEKKRSVAVKARKAALQRKGNSKSDRRQSKV